MFNLETKISEWRRQMLAAGMASPVPLDELEAHLREEFEQLSKTGCAEAEAFERAVQKIGKAPVIQGEFKKIGLSNGVLEWKIMEIAFGLAGSGFPLWIAAILLHFKTGGFADMTRAQQISGLAAVGLFTLLVWAGRLSWRILPVLPGKRARGTATIFCIAPGILWWIVFMDILVPRYDFTMGQFGVAFLWAFIAPAGAMIGLPWGIEAAARKRIAILAR